MNSIKNFKIIKIAKGVQHHNKTCHGKIAISLFMIHDS